MQQASLGYNLVLGETTVVNKYYLTNFCWFCVSSKRANEEDNNQK